MTGFTEELRPTGANAVTFCTIRTPSDMAFPFAVVRFLWIPTSEEPSAPIPDATAIYAAGSEAWIVGDSGFIGFPCSAGEVEEYDQLVGYLTIRRSGGITEPDLVMEVLNAMASAVAEELGCAEEAELPSGAPQRIEG